MRELTLFPLAELPVVLKDDWPADFEAQFWATYPKRVAKLKAMAALAKVRKAHVRWSTLMEGVARYAQKVARADPKFTAHPATWLNQGRWEDEPEPEMRRPRSLGDIARGR